MVFKSQHGLAPDYLASKFSERNTSYNLRDSENKLNVRLPRTNYFRNSFSYSASTLRNRLPYEARCAESLRSFKRQISKARHSHGKPLFNIVQFIVIVKQFQFLSFCKQLMNCPWLNEVSFIHLVELIPTRYQGNVSDK